MAAKHDDVPVKFGLTEGERACIDALASGLSQQRVAEVLNLHVRTVEEHLRSARNKLQAKTTNQLVAIATYFELLGPMWKSTIDAYQNGMKKRRLGR
ncbi:MAG: helix-turn-helix transcriptional regulator [Rhodobacter sp.]|nr:helix-turn-helix transcriptional regulator [Rhodobacter sp.]